MEVEGTKLQANFKCDFNKFPSIKVMKKAIILFTFDAMLASGGRRIPNAAMINNYSVPRRWRKKMFHIKIHFFYKWAGLRLRKIKTFGNKAIISFWGTRHFFKPCKDQITDILIFGLIFTSDIKTLHLFANLIFYKLPKLFWWEFLELISFFCFENFLVWSLKEIRY